MTISSAIVCYRVMGLSVWIYSADKIIPKPSQKGPHNDLLTRHFETRCEPFGVDFNITVKSLPSTEGNFR